VGKPDLDVATRQCAGSRVAPYLQFSGKTSDIRCAHPSYSLNLAAEDVFMFPKLKTTLKGRRFRTIEEIQENALRDLRAIKKVRSRKHSNSERYVEDGVSPVEGLLLRGRCLQCCKMSSKVFIEKGRSFFEHVLYMYQTETSTSTCMW
jgi:hypothetical protein